MQTVNYSFSGFIAVLILTAASQAWAHGDVTPQPVDTSALEPIENAAEWLETNPYSGNEKAAEIGHHAFAQNCARCHGIDAVSGGIAPDLRERLPLGAEGDEIFKERMINGAIRNGVTYMPKFEGLIAQEGLWAIRTWLETVSVDAPPKDEAKAEDNKTDEAKSDDKAAADSKEADSKTAENK
ncbi:MAG: cytochrome c-550 PedF [Thiothrix sp.]